MNDHVPLTATSNICELSTVGASMGTVLFSYPGGTSSRGSRGRWRRWVWLVGGLAATGVDDHLYAALGRIPAALASGTIRSYGARWRIRYS